MTVYLVTLHESDVTEWGLMSAEDHELDSLIDIVRCPHTDVLMRVVLRFEAPDWESARSVFDWKSEYDLKVPKHLLS